MCLLVAAGCGRFSFDPLTGDGGTSGDGGGGCPAFAIFCEDFESGSLLPRWPTVETAGNGTATITTARPHGGARSLEATVPNTGSSGNGAAVAPIGPFSSGTLAVREWVNATVPIENFDLVSGFGDANVKNYTTVGGDNVGNWVISEARTGNTMPTDSSSTTPTTANTWVCVELVFTFGSTPHTEVFVNDTQVLSTNSITPSPTFSYVRVGAVRGDNLGFHVFVDDVVVATQRIGCT